MTDPISARLREDVFYGEERMIKFGKHNPLHMEAADHIDAQAATIKALVEALEWAKIDISEVAEICWDKRDPEAAKIACAAASGLASEVAEKMDAALSNIPRKA